MTPPPTRIEIPERQAEWYLSMTAADGDVVVEGADHCRPQRSGAGVARGGLQRRPRTRV